MFDLGPILPAGLSDAESDLSGSYTLMGATGTFPIDVVSVPGAADGAFAIGDAAFGGSGTSRASVSNG